MIFTDQGTKKFSELTAGNIDRRLAFVFDGKVLSAPTIRSKIGRTAMIAMGPDKSDEEAANLVKTLNEIIDARSPTTAPESK